MLAMLKKQNTQPIPIVFALTSLLFCLCTFGLGTVSIDREQENHLLLDIVNANPQTAVAAYGCLESSWVFYGGAPIRELLIEELESEFGADSQPKTRSDPTPTLENKENYWQCKPRISVEAFLESNSQVMFLTSSDHVEKLKERLPEDYQVLRTAAYFLKNKQIILVGKPSALTALKPDRNFY